MGSFRAGICSGTTDAYACSPCRNAQCGTLQVRVGQCAGTTNAFVCNPCANIVCGQNQYRAGTCSGETDGFTCVDQPTCQASQYLAGGTALAKGQCVNQPDCPPGQKLSGATPTERGVCAQCPDKSFLDVAAGVCKPCAASPQSTCSDGAYRAGRCAGAINTYTCTPCDNTECGASSDGAGEEPDQWRYRVGTCGGTINGYVCVPQPVCKAGEYLSGAALRLQQGACMPCSNTTCGATQRREGVCRGRTNGYTCVDVTTTTATTTTTTTTATATVTTNPATTQGLVRPGDAKNKTKAGTPVPAADATTVDDPLRAKEKADTNTTHPTPASRSDDNDKDGSDTAVLIVIVILLVLGACGVAAFFICRRSGGRRKGAADTLYVDS